MPINGSDIRLRYSIAAGTAGNQLASGGPGTSRGRYVSTTVITSGVLNNLFPDVTGDENASMNVDYQCVFIHNAHATLTLQNTRVWMASQVAGGADAAYAVDPTAASALGAAGVQAAEIGSKDVAPTGVGPWLTATAKAGGAVLGNIGPGQVKAVWIRRSATNSGATSNDGLTLRVEGDTAA